MKKVIFINIFSAVGGGEIYLKRLIQKLQPFISPDSYILTPSCKILDKLSINRVEVHGVQPTKRVSFLLDLLKTLIEIRKFIKESNPDVVIINGDRAILMAPFLKGKYKLIGIKHMLLESAFKYIINFLPFCSLSTLVTISNYHVTNYTRFWFSGYFKQKIKMIYNAVDINHFCVSCILPNEHAVSFVEVATLEERKGQIDLLYAFKELKDEGYDINLLFVGAGKDYERYKSIVADLDLNNDIWFTGFQNDIRPYLSKENTVLMLPSYDEGLPFVLLEAMSCSVPVISTTIAGIPEVIESEVNGFIHTPGNRNEIKLYMKRFIESPALIRKMGAHGRIKAEKIFSENVWISKWTHLI